MSDLSNSNYADLLEYTNNIVDEAFNGEMRSKEDFDTSMSFLDLAACLETDPEAIEFTSADAVLYQNTGLMVCLLCLEDVDANLLSEHMAQAHAYRKVQLQCHICNTKFTERSSLKTHKKECPSELHPNLKSIPDIMKELHSNNKDCPISNGVPQYTLKDHPPRYTLKDHLVYPELVTCDICKGTFKNMVTMKEHVKFVHQLVEETEQCEECGQMFRSQKYLGKHRRNVHSTDKVHPCTSCGKIFKSRLCLQRHTRVESKVKQQHLRVLHRSRSILTPGDLSGGQY